MMPHAQPAGPHFQDDSLMDSSREQNIDKPAVCQKIENSIDLPNKDDNEEEAEEF